MPTEDELGWIYFGPDPMTSPRMTEHMDWHQKPENQPGTRSGNYGERFLDFHRDFIAEFDAFRLTQGLIPVSGWDPSTKIPPDLAHPHQLTAPRSTDDPYSVNPHCKTPTWCTVVGGTDVDPVHGYSNLLQFRSVDELGWSIDTGWHGTVHNTIGGDMSMFHSPIDPIFWRWHRWIDNVRATWQAAQPQASLVRITAVVRVLFGVTNDAPGVVIGPDGVPHHVPGGPGDPFRSLSSVMQSEMVGQLIGEIAPLMRSTEHRSRLKELAQSFRL